MVVIASTILTLTEYAQDVLGVAETSLALTEEGTPLRSYISPAAPTLDCCPMLAVHVSSLIEAPTSPFTSSEVTARRMDFGTLILASYVITAVRCAPVPDQHGNAPTIEEIEAVSVMVQQDGWALRNGFQDALVSGDIFDGCLGAHLDEGIPIEEQGGCVGWLFTIRASIPGYAP